MQNYRVKIRGSPSLHPEHSPVAIIVFYILEHWSFVKQHIEP